MAFPRLSGRALPAPSAARRSNRIVCLALGLLLSLSVGTILAGTAEDPAEVQNLPAAPPVGVLNSTLVGSHGPAPVLFPPTQAGWPGEARDPRDVTPYLAFHKAAMAARAERAALRSNGLRRDPTPNQTRFDARYYDLNLVLNPSTSTLTGVVTGRFTITNGPLGQIELDLNNNMAVSGVTSGGNAASYTHVGAILSVNLDRSYNSGENVTLVVSYSGNPNGDAWGWDTEAGQPMIWTLSEPYGGRTWWPSKDWSDDKADSVDMRVTAPTGLLTASNGKLRQQTDNGITSYSWWHEGHPIATYLVSLATHNYHVYSEWYRPSPTDSMEVRFYNYQSSYPGVVPVQSLVPSMIGAYAARFGEYPFLDEKYGHAEFPWGGGMEHQTCTSLGAFYESVVAHELGHQWWGDMITCRDFHHVWLNEGFATYCEAIWAESNGGMQAYHDQMNVAQYFGSGTIYVPDLTDWNRIFDSNLSYNKASWVLHMLRGVVGDTQFFQILRTFYDQYEYSVATTEDFRAVAESISGRDLSAFFQEWIYGEYYPVYQYAWSSTQAGGGWDVNLHIQQVQSGQIFTMPIQTVVQTAAGSQTFTLDNSLTGQDYTLHVAAQPIQVDLDPDRWILRVVLSPMPPPTFDRNILLVNAVSWDAYNTEIRSSYQDRAFWGSNTVDFWDCFPTPSGGYPTTLPTPLGHGSIPGTTLGHYRTVIWVGGSYGGDQDDWNNTPMYSYLQAGGNVILMTRQADSYLVDPFRSYLGISWIGNGTVTDCISTYAGLTNIGRLGTQSYIAGFATSVGAESTLLYKAVSGHSPNWGLGVIRVPANGGTYNPHGGRFVLLSGRPYRWVHADLRTNMEYILQYFTVDPAEVDGDEATALPLSLAPALPNPFGRETTLRFSLPGGGPARLAVWDVGGRRVAELLNGPMSAGRHTLNWDGRDQSGHAVPSGVYYLRLEAGGKSAESRVLRLR
jgi:aminopeptidase N